MKLIYVAKIKLGKVTKKELQAISTRQINDVSQLYGFGDQTIKKLKQAKAPTSIKALKRRSIKYLKGLGFLNRDQIKIIQDHEG